MTFPKWALPSLKAPWMKAAKQAVEVIKWFNNHGTALDLLRSQQLTTFGKILALIVAVLTRWVSQYCSLRRLKKLEKAIRACVITHKEKLRLCAGRTDEQIAAAERIIDICKDNSFWMNVEQ